MPQHNLGSCTIQRLHQTVLESLKSASVALPWTDIWDSSRYWRFWEVLNQRQITRMVLLWVPHWCYMYILAWTLQPLAKENWQCKDKIGTMQSACIKPSVLFNLQMSYIWPEYRKCQRFDYYAIAIKVISTVIHNVFVGQCFLHMNSRQTCQSIWYKDGQEQSCLLSKYWLPCITIFFPPKV